MILYARSSSSALAALGNTPRLTLRCLSSHEHACNFQTPTGALLAVVTPYHGNGPFHIVLPTPLPRSLTLQQNTMGYWQPGEVIFGTLQIKLTHAASWDPYLPMSLPLSRTSTDLLHESTNQFSPSPLSVGGGPLRERAQQAMACLRLGLMEQNQERVKTGSALLAGLGPGLTPAGDDFLVGLLAALQSWSWHVPADKRKNRALCSTIAAAAAQRTTRLSATWLQYAGQGCFGEAWHQLITALNGNVAENITTAAQRILTTGATSGVDAMSGFLFGLNVLQGKGEI